MSISPRQELRRAKTDSEGDIERFNVKLRKIKSNTEKLKKKSNSEKLSRKSRPDRKARRVIHDMKALPRPRSPSTSEAYLDVLNAIEISIPGCEKQILKLAQKPDLSQWIEQALNENSLKPLEQWPEKLWNKRAYRLLITDKETGELRENQHLTVRLLASWMKEYGTMETYLREDSGGGRKLFKYLLLHLDSWQPIERRDLFRQCIIHCMSLPPPLLQVLKQLRKEVRDLNAETLISAILLACYFPKAQQHGFNIQEIKVAMKSCSEPPKECMWMMERVRNSVAPKKRFHLSTSSVES